MEVFVTFLLDLLFTAVSYLLVPIIFCLSKKELSDSQIKKLVIVNGVCVWLIFTIIRIGNGIDGTSAAVFLWSGIAYWLMRKHCLEKEKPVSPETEEKYIPKHKTTPAKTEKMSLSFENETPKKYGNYNVYGADLRLQPEEHETYVRTTKKEADIIYITSRLKTDEDFYTAVKTINEFDKEKLSSLLRFLK